MYTLKSKHLTIPFFEVFAKAISFINILIFMRVLSVNDYAIYSYVLSIVLWASVLMDGGISNLIYKKSLNHDRSNLSSFFYAKIILSLAIIFLLVLFFFFKKNEYVTPIILLSFLILFSSISSLFKMFARGSGYTDVDITTILSEPIIRLFSLLFVFVTAEKLNWTLNNVLLVYLLAGLIALLLNYLKLKKYYRFRIVRNSLQSVVALIKKLYNETKYYLLYYLMAVGVNRIDILFLEQFSSKNNLALYSSAINLFQVVQLFFFSLITSQFLLLLRKKSVLIQYLIPSILVIIFITFSTSKFVYQFLYPDDYLNGYIVLDVLILALLPSVINYYLITKNNYFNNTKRNFIILFAFFILKFSIYSLLKSVDIKTYYTVFTLIEYGILCVFLIYNKINESPSNK